ncbi:MAG: MotA/TolQ/ExbB proton channel family protein [Planctomycetes bacterium]|nr:MotA/TolQ/ExbB proton channel family protein [Planctomycetota bacterium]
MREVFIKGGPVMWPILVCSIVVLALAIERLLTLRRSRAAFRRFVDELRPHCERGSLREALRHCDASSLGLARLFRAAVASAGLPKSEIRERVDEVAQLELPDLEKRIGILATIAQVAPLLGLLGTVTGMIRAFQAIQAVAASGAGVNPGHLAGGIWEALITTVAGLCVAIPAYISYNWLVIESGRLIADVERACAEIVNLLVARERAARRTAAPVPEGVTR